METLDDALALAFRGMGWSEERQSPTWREEAALKLYQHSEKVEDNTGFFYDLLSILTNLIAQELLPKLHEKGEAAPLHDEVFAWASSVRDKAHRETLLAEIDEAMGRFDRARQRRRDAFEATEGPVMLLSRGQAVWADLIEADDLDGADFFALKIANKVDPRDLPEIENWMNTIHLRRKGIEAADRIAREIAALLIEELDNVGEVGERLERYEKARKAMGLKLT